MPYNVIKAWTFITLVVIAWPTQAESLRCGSQLINTHDHISEIHRKCGKPSSRANLGYVEVSDRYGGRSEVRVEEWIYGPWNGMYYYLTFRGNRLHSIQSKRGQ
jgi:hypothetical protein